MQGSVLTVDDSEVIEPIAPERLSWIEQQLAKLSFHHWTFTLEESGPGLEPLVWLRFVTTDSTNPSRPFTAENAYRVEDLPSTVEAFGFWALAAITAAQMHETAEQVMFDGKPIIDPHSPAYRQCDGALYIKLCESARTNGDPFHDVLYAAGMDLVTANGVPGEIKLAACRDHLQRNVAPRRVQPRAIAAV